MKALLAPPIDRLAGWAGAIAFFLAILAIVKLLPESVISHTEPVKQNPLAIGCCAIWAGWAYKLDRKDAKAWLLLVPSLAISPAIGVLAACIADAMSSQYVPFVIRLAVGAAALALFAAYRLYRLHKRGAPAA